MSPRRTGTMRRGELAGHECGPARLPSSSRPSLGVGGAGGGLTVRGSF